MDNLAAAVLAATSSKNTAGSSAASLIFILIIGLAAYLLFIRPRSMAARRQRDTLQELAPGDEVVTTAGIIGTVVEVAADRVTLETAPGTHLTLLRSAVVRRITPDTVPPDDEWDADEHEPDTELDEHEAELDDEGPGSGASDNGHGPGVRQPLDPPDGEARS